MFNEKLEDFMTKIRYVNEKVCFYEGECKYPLTPQHLLARVDKIEACTEKTNNVSEYDKLLFEKKITKLDYKEIEKEIIIPKNEKTGNKKDQYTLISELKPAVEIWKVSNQVGLFTCFTTQEEAIALYEKINNEVVSHL